MSAFLELLGALDRKVIRSSRGVKHVGGAIASRLIATVQSTTSQYEDSRRRKTNAIDRSSYVRVRTRSDSLFA